MLCQVIMMNARVRNIIQSKVTVHQEVTGFWGVVGACNHNGGIYDG